MFDTALPLSILLLRPNLAHENLFKPQFLHLSAGFTLIWLVRRKLVNLCVHALNAPKLVEIECTVWNTINLDAAEEEKMKCV